MATEPDDIESQTDWGDGARLGQPHEAYVAFAFAAADLLMECEMNGRVIFAIGAAMSLVGRPARLLANMELPDLFLPSDRSRVVNALKRMASGERIRHVLLHIQLPDENGPEPQGIDPHGSVPVAMSGYPHPDHEGRLLLVLTHSGTITQPSLRRNDEGLMGRDGFEALASTLIKESADGEDDGYRMTLVELPSLADARTEAGTEATAEFMSKFSGYLRDTSVGGQSAAEFGGGKYGLLHGPEVDSDAIETAIDNLAKAIMGTEMRSEAASVVFDSSSISAQEAVSALVYTLNRFTSDSGGTVSEMSKTARPTLSNTVTKMREVKATIGSGQFELYFQPIVDLWSNVVHHFECLVRFGDAGASPYNTVVFAEDTGLVGELDLAICTRAIEFMRGSVGTELPLRFAVNLSGRSLSSPALAARLLRLIGSANDLRGRLMFELTESAAISDLEAVNAVLQEIRGRGHPVGIDDFGSGSAAFHYLRALKVDHVKIDGSYVKNAVQNGESLPFLRAITQLCRELKIASVAEHIEDEATSNLLRVYNVRYGQGYYFGKPMLPAIKKMGAKAPWVTPQVQWRNGLLFFRSPGAIAADGANRRVDKNASAS